MKLLKQMKEKERKGGEMDTRQKDTGTNLIELAMATTGTI